MQNSSKPDYGSTVDCGNQAAVSGFLITQAFTDTDTNACIRFPEKSACLFSIGLVFEEHISALAP